MKIADRMDLLGTETAFKVLQQIQNFPLKNVPKLFPLRWANPISIHPNILNKRELNPSQRITLIMFLPAGLMELREEAAKWAGARQHIKVTPDMVCIHPAGKIIIGFAVLTCMNAGDEVIYPNPGYPIYESMIRVFSGKPIPALLKESDHWNYNVDALRRMITNKTKMIVLKFATKSYWWITY